MKDIILILGEAVVLIAFLAAVLAWLVLLAFMVGAI